MGTRKEISPMVRVLRPLLVGTGIGILVCAAILLIVAAIMTTGILPSGAVTPVSLATAAIGAFFGGFVAAKLSRERGLLYGAGVGLMMFLLITGAGIAMSQELRGMMMLIKAALMIGVGALGGVIGVNIKRGR